VYKCTPYSFSKKLILCLLSISCPLIVKPRKCYKQLVILYANFIKNRSKEDLLMSVSLIFPSHSYSICMFLILKFNPYVFATFMHYGVNESTYIYI
jgi:hypothetical protein